METVCGGLSCAAASLFCLCRDISAPIWRRFLPDFSNFVFFSFYFSPSINNKKTRTKSLDVVGRSQKASLQLQRLRSMEQRKKIIIDTDPGIGKFTYTCWVVETFSFSVHACMIWVNLYMRIYLENFKGSRFYVGPSLDFEEWILFVRWCHGDFCGSAIAGSWSDWTHHYLRQRLYHSRH